MVHKQSTYKFRTASIIYKKNIELDVENNKSDKAYDKLLHDIICFFMLYIFVIFFILFLFYFFLFNFFIFFLFIFYY